MRMSVAAVRRAVAAGPVGRAGYPAAVRAALVALAPRRQAAGEALRGVAADLGVSHEALRRWMKHGTSTFRSVALRPGRAVTEAPGGQAVFFLPGGVRVEGLDVDGVAELVRRLS